MFILFLKIIFVIVAALLIIYPNWVAKLLLSRRNETVGRHPSTEYSWFGWVVRSLAISFIITATFGMIIGVLLFVW